ncbi:Alpha-(1,3)-fucosyltransferase 11 [Podila clonocystis]|nr:Alpha-(1,3)-fucosyltransferase 11 [Podila clonocystis]
MLDIDVKKEYSILWWAPWFNDPQVFEGVVVDNCDLPYTCKFTHNRDVYDEAKIIVYHGTAFNPKDTSRIEDVKSGNKAWVLMSLEAPKPYQIKSEWTNVFTHTWTYSFHSDFVQSYFKAGRGPDTFISNILAKPKYTIQEKNTFRKEGLAPIAWIVSSCTSENGRHFYVKQLQKYTKVDIYGHCMSNKEFPKGPDRKDLDPDLFIGKYKFYLAIENTNCNDYVSEKINKPYVNGLVPIVDGPKDYSRYLATNHSAIRMDDFATPEQLADFINELDKDDARYLTYLDYKKKPAGTPLESFLSPKLLEAYDVSPGTWGPDSHGARCGVCKLAHDMAEAPKGTFVFSPNKTIGLDRTCAFSKWAFNTWAIEFYWWIIALVILGIAVGWIVGNVIFGRRLRRNTTGWLARVMACCWARNNKDGELRMMDYSRLPVEE